MAYRLVRGEFHLFYSGKNGVHVGSQPDGDSVWFKPNNKAHLKNIGGRNAKYNQKGKGDFTQLRLEGIDALELHYEGAHQKEAETVDARDSLLKGLGFNEVKFSKPTNLTAIPTHVSSASPHPIPGYILTRNIDPYGRPVSFVFKGNPKPVDRSGEEVWLDLPRFKKSLNAQLTAAGHVYPGYYTGLPVDIRDAITTLAQKAQKSPKQVWKVDRSIKGAKVASLQKLHDLALWPKLFRRLVKYFKEGNANLSNFNAWLRSDPNNDDQLWIISRGEYGNLHDVVKVAGKDKIKMTYRSEDIVIVPR